jgi:hypothetical protein
LRTLIALLYSSKEITTAEGLSCRVIACGPSLRALRTTSLNDFLHVAVAMFSLSSPHQFMIVLAMIDRIQEKLAAS